MNVFSLYYVNQILEFLTILNDIWHIVCSLVLKTSNKLSAS